MRAIKKEDNIKEGWESHKYLKFVRKNKKIRKIAKTILNFIGLENLRLVWEFPRPTIRHVQLSNIQHKNLIGAEVGVWAGANAKNILETLPIKKLYLVDPYEIYEDYNRSLTIHKKFNSLKLNEEIYGKNPNKVLLEAEKKAKEKLSKHKDKIVWIKKRSSDALKDLPNNLDFVYIDGNHEYEYVKEDIENYYKKLRDGGILGGDDIGSVAYPGVIKAFIEFVAQKRLKPHIDSPDWWVVKGEFQN